MCQGWMLCFILGLTLASQITGARIISDHSREGVLIGYSEQARQSEHQAAGAKVVIETIYGSIKITPYTEKSPINSRLVLDLAAVGSCPACNFYRHEHIPENWGRGGFSGPPYALLQGSLAGVAQDPVFENAIPIRPGHVCFIPNCREFFIATAAHTEWGFSHSVWGEVDETSLAVIAAAPFEPSFIRTDASVPPIITTWLNESFPFSIRLETLPSTL